MKIQYNIIETLPMPWSRNGPIPIEYGQNINGSLDIQLHYKNESEIINLSGWNFLFIVNDLSSYFEKILSNSNEMRLIILEEVFLYTIRERNLFLSSTQTGKDFKKFTIDAMDYNLAIENLHKLSKINSRYGRLG